ncbi:maleylpyruvate isomerase family mycothiol-dependent enzyme [Micrococcus sp. EYE_162]|uniref:maleylpyruvate isomerase family mycothiol-dependent enzyme n=1 Tax=unclassified Micrococcus TaxID=2620948 RepID=UPI0020033002|nr:MULTISPECIES: maleylpyruvate isomerase family mycothiol-dependent enzyme [unclassified Micrococcus]MCK6095647.1 maleylpyruvate isomerase family mycothiol-dependent enzyme [Micrococcus sp. EYE_212]MCK6171722.1 maleylpyruvate isomerase family mycothiol-dependent enzyme [Micrococcus sp. EYE_162]
MAETPAAAQHTATDFAVASRAALVEALLAAGPGAPTLCEGWRTEHLAAHVHLRETSPSAAGIVLPGVARRRLAQLTQELGDAHASEEGYAELVALVARGPLRAPGEGPRVAARLRGLAAAARRTAPGRRVAGQVQLLEFFVHTEDVRRAQERWAPRILADDYADMLYTRLRGRARLLYRGAETGIVLARRPRPASRVDNAPIVARRPGEDGVSVRVTGAAGELVLHAHGRRRAALVTTDRVTGAA